MAAPFFPPGLSRRLASCAHWADRLVRADLIAGLIATEKDYTSNFTSALRREINARHLPGLTATAYVLRPTLEQHFGGDACVILASTSGFKICLFEAKWPRLSTHKDCWDYVQRSTGESHFHGQLQRQSMAAYSFAVREMFYCEFPFGAQPSFMPNEGSACVWHQHAKAQSSARPWPKVPWDDLELTALLSAHPMTIDQAIMEVCQCKAGKVFAGSDYLQPFSDFGAPSQVLVIAYSGKADVDQDV
jgi:hypothetical protein